jgi:hypothetical protein
MLDAGSNSIDLDLATASELAAFIKDVEDRYVQWIVNNRQAFFGNDNCTVERFNSHVKEDSVRFGCKGAILFDPQGKVIDAIPAHTRVSAIVEIGDGWFFQGQWGVKMKCSQVKAYKRVPQQCGFVDDGDAVLTESLCSGSMPSTPPAMDTCGFRDD